MNNLTLEFYTDRPEQAIENLRNTIPRGGVDEIGEYVQMGIATIHWTIHENRSLLTSAARQYVKFNIRGMSANSTIKAYMELEQFLESQEQPKEWASSWEDLGLKGR